MTKFHAAAQNDRQLWQPNYAALPNELPSLPEPEISGCSFRFFCTFTLQTCFFSGRDRAGAEKKVKDKDEEHHQQKQKQEDEEFNNHLCRDWISGRPLAKAGAWKRLFRSCWPEPNAAELDRLFGPEPKNAKEEEKLSKAELKFHHAFFPLNSTGKALIAPRDEKTGKVSPGPITYEVVQKGSRCEVMIDYLPRRNVNASEAERMLWKLWRAALAVKDEGAAIGGKSGIWGHGRFFLNEMSVMRNPDMPRSKSNESIRDRRTA